MCMRDWSYLHLIENICIFVCFSKKLIWLSSGHNFQPAFCELCFQYLFSFKAFVVLFRSILGVYHRCQSEIWVFVCLLIQVSLSLVCWVGSDSLLCLSGVSTGLCQSKTFISWTKISTNHFDSVYEFIFKFCHVYYWHFYHENIFMKFYLLENTSYKRLETWLKINWGKNKIKSTFSTLNLWSSDISLLRHCCFFLRTLVNKIYTAHYWPQEDR